MPAVAKRYIAEHNINVYTINAIDLAIEIGSPYGQQAP